MNEGETTIVFDSNKGENGEENVPKSSNYNDPYLMSPEGYNNTTVISALEEEQREIESLRNGKGCHQGCQNNSAGWTITILLWLCFILAVIIDFYYLISNAFFILNTIFNYPFIIFYLIHFIYNYCGSFCDCRLTKLMLRINNNKTNTKTWLNNINSLEYTQNQIEYFVKSEPKIKLIISCYHYETRTRQVSHTDADGHTTWETETYEERVNTHSATQYYEYDECVDISDTSLTITVNNIIFKPNLLKLNVLKTFSMGNDESKNHWDNTIEKFKKDNDKDEYQSFGYNLIIDNFQQNQLKFLVNAEELPWWMTDGFLCLGILFGCAVCWKTGFSARSHKKSIVIHKKIFKNANGINLEIGDKN